MGALDIRTLTEVFSDESGEIVAVEDFDVEGADPELTLGIRPEDIEVVDADARNAVETTVEVTEPLGDMTYLYFDIEGTQYTATIDGDYVFTAGQTVSVRFPEDWIHLFDRRSGEAIHNREPPDGGDFPGTGFGEDGTGTEVSAE